MSYQLLALPRVGKGIKRSPHTVQQRIRNAIMALGDEPRPPGVIKMTNDTHWRIRVGEYRVVYQIDDQRQTVTIIDVGHRKDIYR